MKRLGALMAANNDKSLDFSSGWCQNRSPMLHCMSSAACLPLFDDIATESPAFLSEQIITYIGNKRSLLNFIGKGVAVVKERLGKKKLSCMDVFSGSGVVARFLKAHSDVLYANDLETYSRIINECYLTNRSEFDEGMYRDCRLLFESRMKECWHAGFITELYSPADEEHITKDDRVFYTRRNAMYIDTARAVIDELPEEMRIYFMAPLLYGASVHNNTSGVFKGFYKNKEGVGQFGGTGKNALTRILKNIEIQKPIFSLYESESIVLQDDAAQAVKSAGEIDFAYFDPPYNQHPYGSNYFMLNLICNNEKPADFSRVSGIPTGWNRSAYNKKKSASEELFKAIDNCLARFILISYNSEGFISHQEFIEELSKRGTIGHIETEYNTFRGCRNLQNRAITVTEYLYLLEKN